MKRQHISELLRGDLSPIHFEHLYKDELKKYAHLNKKIGASTPIFLNGDEYIFIDKKNIQRLLNFAAKDEIKLITLAYLLDALSLDEKAKFVDLRIKDVVCEIADNEFTHADIKSFLESGGLD